METDKHTILKMVGLFNDSFPPIMDGVAVAVQSYAYWMTRKKIPTCVVTPNMPHYRDEEIFPVYRYPSIPLHISKPYRLGFPDIDHVLKQKMGKLDFSLIHAHCPFTAGHLGLRIARQRKVPIVGTFHSKFKEDFERTFRTKTLVNLLIKEIVSFFEKMDEVWIPQAAVEESLREYGFKGKVAVVDNGSDFSIDGIAIEEIKDEARVKLGVDEDELMLLFIGQHIWEKNTQLILDTLLQIKSHPFKMFFVGSGYAKEEMISFTQKNELTDKIIFVDEIQQRDLIKEYYAAADLFLFPSLYDNAPLVVREAASLCTPSILIQGSTAADIISDDFNGFLIENTVNSFVKKLISLFADREKIKEVSLNASLTVSRSWENVVEEVIDRYINLVARKATHHK